LTDEYLVQVVVEPDRGEIAAGPSRAHAAAYDIGAVRVCNKEVFAEPQPFLQSFNNLHMTTKESAICAKAVVAPG
jgi:hypothetical protein